MSFLAPKDGELLSPSNPSTRRGQRSTEPIPSRGKPTKTTDEEALPRDDESAWTEERERRLSKGFDWATIGWIAMIHVGAAFAFFTFSWIGLAVAVGLAWLTACIGITLGFHRQLTHRSFTTYTWVRYVLAFVGGLAGEGSALFWCAHHRKHHALSDRPGDPHSPLDGPYGGLWSHILWLVPRTSDEDRASYVAKWVPDLAKDPVLVFLDHSFIFWHVALALALGGIGYAIGGWYMAASLVVYGMFVRLFWVLHSTWFVNSASHIWGYRNYETTDESRNLWWVALLTYGEGWHNNHHAYPRMANHGHRWWEFDMTFSMIRLMQLCGLAWDVVDYKRKGEGA